MKKTAAWILLVILLTGCLAGCGNGRQDKNATHQNGQENGEEQDFETIPGADTGETVKIGILVTDSTTAEALAFQAYYKEYITQHYNVEMIYSKELTDAAGEVEAIDTFIAEGCKAVISLSSFDRLGQLEQCTEAEIYYAVATGTLTANEYESVKRNEYYVGAIGPSLDIEYQTGLSMAEYYLEQGMTEFAIFGGAIPMYTGMHVYRAAGMLAAMVEAGGKDADYLGAVTKEEIVGKIMETGTVEPTTIGDIHLLGYVGGYNMDEAWYAKCDEMANIPGLQVILAVGNGSDFFAEAVQGTEVKIASVDTYAEAYGQAMEEGSLDYLAGKFSASIGPVFLAVYRAVSGVPLRNDEGYAFAIDQGYWVATSPEQFQEYYAVDSSLEAPAYTADMLNTLFDIDYAGFEEFVCQYSFDEIKDLQQ